METIAKSVVHEFLTREQNKYAVLSTIGGPGGVESALMGVAPTQDLEIVFDTVQRTRKYANLRADPRCAFVIGLSGAITVQYEGVAREISADSPLVRDVYFKAFPDGPDRLAWEGIVYFAVKPTWLRYCDYTQTPPLLAEIQF
jgi:hypothetical protein